MKLRKWGILGMDFEVEEGRKISSSLRFCESALKKTLGLPPRIYLYLNSSALLIQPLQRQESSLHRKVNECIVKKVSACYQESNSTLIRNLKSWFFLKKKMHHSFYEIHSRSFMALCRRHSSLAGLAVSSRFKSDKDKPAFAILKY